MFTSQITDRREVGNITVHGKYAVGHDQLAPGLTGTLELLSQVLRIVVSVTEAGCFAKSHTIYDRGMIEGVREDRVFFVEYGLEEARVGIETGGVQDDVLHPKKGREPSFQFFMEGLRSTNKAHAGQAIPPLVEGIPGGLHHFWVVGQAKVVIGTKVEDRRVSSHLDAGRLSGFDHPFRFVEAGGMNFLQFRLQLVLDLAVHATTQGLLSHYSHRERWRILLRSQRSRSGG